MVLNFVFSSVRNKFILFVLSIILFSVWAFLHNLDGMALILLTAEFTIVLLFLMTYTQLYSNFLFLTTKKPSIFLYLVLFIAPFLTNFSSTITYTNYYQSLNHVVSSDFFVIYYLLFDKLPILTIFLTLIISLFSLFFILVYFNLKFVKNLSSSKLKQKFFLRKQNLIKQTNFKSKTYTFQN